MPADDETNFLTSAEPEFWVHIKKEQSKMLEPPHTHTWISWFFGVY